MATTELNSVVMTWKQAYLTTSSSRNALMLLVASNANPRTDSKTPLGASVCVNPKSVTIYGIKANQRDLFLPYLKQTADAYIRNQISDGVDGR